MRLLKGVLGGFAACLAGTVAAEAANQRETDTARLEYVRVCDASGVAFFVVPGTDICFVRGEPSLGTLHQLGPSPVVSAANPYPWDTAWEMTGFETDPGESEIWTERDFIGTRVPRREELLAYTATFGGAFSPSISFEDPGSRLAAELGTIASLPDAEPISINGIPAPSFRAAPGGREVREIIGNVRPDEPLGAVQVDAAALQVHAGLFTSQAPNAPSPAYPVPAPKDSYGLGVQGGIQPNLDYLSPGDRLWLQAAYENDTYGTIAGRNPDSTSGAEPADPNRFGRAVFAPFDSVYGWSPQANPNCAWNSSATCQNRQGRESSPDASKPSLLPTFSSAGFGPGQDVRYTPSAIAGFGGAVAMPKLEDGKLGPSFIGMPITGFDIGAEFMYINVKQGRKGDDLPVSHQHGGPSSASTPTVKGNQTEYQGRLRVQRAF